MTTPDLIFQVFVQGDLIHERRCGPDDAVEKLAEAQAGVCLRAEAAGLSWKIVVTDPDDGRVLMVAVSG